MLTHAVHCCALSYHVKSTSTLDLTQNIRSVKNSNNPLLLAIILTHHVPFGILHAVHTMHTSWTYFSPPLCPISLPLTPSPLQPSCGRIDYVLKVYQSSRKSRYTFAFYNNFWKVCKKNNLSPKQTNKEEKKEEKRKELSRFLKAYNISQMH